MPRYLVTGGRQKATRLKRRDEWHAYGSAVLVELDTDTGRSRAVLEYQSPPGRRPVQDPSFVFKAASWDGDHLLLCTQTEVLVYDPRAHEVVRTISHPWFNDLHHVARIGGRLHVVSTGLDALLILDDDDQVVEVHGAIEGRPWDRFDRDTDYRLVATTKPHGAHPNYVFEADGGLWLTRFEQRDAVRIDGQGATEGLAEDPIHDGVLHSGRAWFTVVSGTVVATDPATGRIAERHDLDTIGGEGGLPLGWCRGLHFEHDRVLLGFSRIRPTKLKQNLAWLRGPLKRPEFMPTRVVAYDLSGGRKLDTWVIEDAGINSVFSILPAEPPR